MRLHRSFQPIALAAGCAAFVAFVAIIADSLVGRHVYCPECEQRMDEVGRYQPPGTDGVMLFKCRACDYELAI